MSRPINKLIEQLLAVTKSRGLSQARLAERVGMTPVGLSKAKSRGDMRASTLEALANQLDMELTLIPRRSKERSIDAIRSGSFFNRAVEPKKGEE